MGLALGLLGLRILLALYLLASALARYDRGPIPIWEIVLRLVVAVLVLWKAPLLMWAGIVLGLLLIVLHAVLTGNRSQPAIS